MRDPGRHTLLNVAQLLFTLFWTLFWELVALPVAALTLDRQVMLRMTREIWARGLLWGAGARLEIAGLDQIDFSKPHVFVANHQSTIDIPVVFQALPANLHFILKKELKRVPLIGWYAWAMGMIFVDRRDSHQSASSLRQAGRLIRSGRSVIAFPEGTRSRTGELLPFKKGAFLIAIEAGVPVVPVAIAGTRAVLPIGGFRVRPGVIQVAIGKPISTANLAAEDRNALSERAAAEIADLLGRNNVPRSSLTVNR